LAFALGWISGYSRRVTFWATNWGRMAMAGVGGLMLALAFPRPGWAALAWAGPVLLLFSAAGLRGVRAYRLGFLGGLVHQLVTLGWLLNIPFPWGAWAGWLALSLYLALFQGLWVWLCWRALEVKGDEGKGWAQAMDALLRRGVWQRGGWVLFCASAWVGLEMIQGRLWSGFPWHFLGVTQYSVLPVVQVAAWTGVYGVSFLVVWVSVSVGLALVRLAREEGRARWVFMAQLRLPVLMVSVVGVAGVLRVGVPRDGSEAVRLALVQPSIPQELIWDEREGPRRFEELMKLSELALATEPDVLVWPESAFPGFTADNFERLAGLVKSKGVWMVFGADDVERRRDEDGVEHLDYYNAAFLLDRQGRVAGAYRKQRLVIFGEYIPLVRWLPFMRHLTPIEGGFTPGERPVVFSLSEPSCGLSVLICFEDVFPHGVRRHMGPAVDVLLNLTNNGWFGQSSAQWQHAANAVFRAVENGVPLVRCTNNGVTCWIDERGRLRQWLGETTGDIYGAGFVTVRVPIRAVGAVGKPTFYSRFGDYFGWGCVGVLGWGLLSACSPMANRLLFRRSNISGSCNLFSI
jgi:apolipoprotein N-acyltransferase